MFDLFHLTPTVRDALVSDASVTWNYDTILNIVFLTITALLALRFLRTGGIAMLRMMEMAPDQGHNHSEHSSLTAPAQ